MAKPCYAQHFTPLHAVDLMYDTIHELYGPLRSPRIIDPACGEGVLLRRAIERHLTSPDRVFGVERDPRIAPSPSGSVRPRAAVADALLGLRWAVAEGAFDLVVANPPYGTGAAGLRDLRDSQAAQIASAYALWAIRRRGDSGKGKTAARVRPNRVRTYPSEVLFLELCVRLARPGGHAAIILPEGILANARHLPVREWLLANLRVDAVVGLPRNTFRRTGAAAKTALLVVTKARPHSRHHILLGEAAGWDRKQADERGSLAFASRRRQSNPALVHRLDPPYWHPDYDRVTQACRRPLVPLDDCVAKLTYGAIVTGEKPPRERQGTAIVNQGQVAFCGVDLSDAARAPLNSPWVSPRAMLQPGDVVLPRSGEGSLGKHKVAVFLDSGPACVGSFVDLIRLRNLNPFYLAAFLKSHLGRAQVSRAANGVGVPNISFSEIRGLLIPRLPEHRQRAIEERYRREVLPIHGKAVARHQEVLRAGGSPGQDQTLRRLRGVGERRWQAIIEELDNDLLGTGERPSEAPGPRARHGRSSSSSSASAAAWQRSRSIG